MPSETVEILSVRQTTGDWVPSIGSQTLSLFDRLELREEDKEKIKTEAISILGKCLSPNLPVGKKTGLVIGYIQSGKTMSFTTLAALAHDNGFKLIIVITGVTKNLFLQSCERLQKDLAINHQRTWKFYQNPPNPKKKPHVIQSIEAAFQSDNTPIELNKQTVLMAVMKNSTHLRNLIALLKALALRGVPTLVIDDEADQASLNTKVRKGGQSTTYQLILDIRDCLPQHTFLQYTATPQAVLLINLIDVLSPDFAEILTPGTAYTGGQVFFEGNFNLIRRIPPDEIPSRSNPLDEPPDSLLDALHIFYLSAAIGLQEDSETGNRSMMIHPSKKTLQHANYTEWARAIQRNWHEILQLDESDPDRVELLEEFLQAYDDLRDTTGTLPDFDELLPYLEYVLRTTVITEVNAAKGSTPSIAWRQDFSNIVVGGEVLNRGYTVEGLTVTYMPRGKGIGNADTIQQRARWFGYKADYLGFCRVFLSDATHQAYQNYVRHEEDVRGQLAQHTQSGKALQEWRRAFLLSTDMRPTRASVLDEPYTRVNFSKTWFWPRAPHQLAEVAKSNRELISQFLQGYDFSPDPGHPKRTPTQIHLLSESAPLSEVFQELLTRLRWPYQADAENFTILLLQLREMLSRTSDIGCDIYVMSGGESRSRSLHKDNQNEIDQLFQGAQYVGGQKTYPGDLHIYSKTRVTIQIHRLAIKNKSSRIVAADIPAVAVKIPANLTSDWLVQDKTMDHEL